MAYQIDDTILYGVHGVCKVTAIEEKNLSGSSSEYYVLKPVQDDKSTVFIPVDNEKLCARMRELLSSEQVRELIATMPGEQTIWDDNDMLRRQRFKEILLSGERSELIQLIKTLHERTEAQKEKGRKLPAADERFMREAENLLYGEFAYVLDIPQEEVLPFIMECLGVAQGAH